MPKHITAGSVGEYGCGRGGREVWTAQQGSVLLMCCQGESFRVGS